MESTARNAIVLACLPCGGEHTTVDLDGLLFPCREHARRHHLAIVDEIVACDCDRGSAWAGVDALLRLSGLIEDGAADTILVAPRVRDDPRWRALLLTILLDAIRNGIEIVSVERGPQTEDQLEEWLRERNDLGVRLLLMDDPPTGSADEPPSARIATPAPPQSAAPPPSAAPRPRPRLRRADAGRADAVRAESVFGDEAVYAEVDDAGRTRSLPRDVAGYGADIDFGASYSARGIRGGVAGSPVRPAGSAGSGWATAGAAGAGGSATAWGGGGRGPEVPVRDSAGPLPHDGLFVRRNNAFGTRSTLGIADLIDQGVLIEQAQIRFDDFVTADTEAIPAPAAGEAVAVSHGVAAVPATFKAHEETTHFLEVALRAAPSAPTGQARPAPMAVNFVFAVDTSISMRGEKLDTAKTAIRELYGQLRDVDVLAVVTFDTRVRTVLRATPKAQIDPAEFTRLVGSLVAEGGTDLNLGINYGLDEIARHRRADVVNSLYVFSDGDPTSGETDWIRIRTNIGSRIRGDVTLSCFGFGSDARMRELDALAGLTGGHSTFVAQPDDVRLTLAEDLDRRDHLAALNIQLRIELPADVTIWHLYGHDLIVDPAARAAVRRDAAAAARRVREDYGAESLPDLIEEEGGIRIFAPDLAYGETYWIVFELQAPSDAPAPDFGEATVQYFDTTSRDNRKVRLPLSASASTAGSGSTAESIPAETVLTHGIGLWTSEITFYALDDLYQNDRETARTRLSGHIEVLRAAEARMPGRQFQNDRVTLAKMISLAANLGTMQRHSDAPGGTAAYVTFTMSAFGQARGGYQTTRRLGVR